MERNEIITRYERGTHRLGRLLSLITLVLLVGAPFLIGSILGTMPDLQAVGVVSLPSDWYGRFPP